MLETAETSGAVIGGATPSEACLASPKVGNTSVMLREQEGISYNHFGPSSGTSTFAAARSAAAHGDNFTAVR